MSWFYPEEVMEGFHYNELLVLIDFVLNLLKFSNHFKGKTMHHIYIMLQYLCGREHVFQAEHAKHYWYNQL